MKKYTLKANHVVWMNNRMMDAREAAELVANAMHPTNGDGVQQELYAPKGLQGLANSYMARKGRNGRLEELQSDGCEQASYFPYWKQ